MPDLTIPFTFDNDPPDTNVIDADEVNSNFSAVKGLIEALADDNFADSVKRIVGIKSRGTNYVNKGSGGVGDGVNNYGDVTTQMQDLSPSITCRGNPFLVIGMFRGIELTSAPEYQVWAAAASDGVNDSGVETQLLVRSLGTNVWHASFLGITTPAAGVKRVGVALRTDNAGAGSIVYARMSALIFELGRATLV